LEGCTSKFEQGIPFETTKPQNPKTPKPQKWMLMLNQLSTNWHYSFVFNTCLTRCDLPFVVYWLSSKLSFSLSLTLSCSMLLSCSLSPPTSGCLRVNERASWSVPMLKVTELAYFSCILLMNMSWLAMAPSLEINSGCLWIIASPMLYTKNLLQLSRWECCCDICLRRSWNCFWLIMRLRSYFCMWKYSWFAVFIFHSGVRVSRPSIDFTVLLLAPLRLAGFEFCWGLI